MKHQKIVFHTLSPEEGRDRFINSSKTNKRIVEMLEEINNGLPWAKEIVKSLNTFINTLGKISNKQKSLVTELYLQTCVTSEDTVKKQQHIRKLLYRLTKVKYGSRSWEKNFVTDLYFKRTKYPYSPAQISRVEKLAVTFRNQLANIPPVKEEAFDGWFVDVMKQETGQ